MKFRVEYNGRAKLCKSGEDALAEVFMTGADKDVLTAVGEWCDSVEKDSKTHAGMQFTFDWRGYHLETVKPEIAKPKPVKRIAPERRKEYYIMRYEPDYEWCLFSVGYNTMEEAERAVFFLKAKQPNRLFSIREDYADECWWNDPFLVN